MLDHVNEIAPYLTQKLQEIVDTCDATVKVKGRGLIQGLQITKPLGEVTAKALEEGLLIIGAGTDVIRMIPSLVIGKEQVDEMVEILKKPTCIKSVPDKNKRIKEPVIGYTFRRKGGMKDDRIFYCPCCRER